MASGYCPGLVRLLALALTLSSISTDARASSCTSNTCVLFDNPVLRITETRGQVSQVCALLSKTTVYHLMHGTDERHDGSCDGRVWVRTRLLLWLLLMSQRRLSMGHLDLWTVMALILRWWSLEQVNLWCTLRELQNAH